MQSTLIRETVQFAMNQARYEGLLRTNEIGTVNTRLVDDDKPDTIHDSDDDLDVPRDTHAIYGT